MPPNAPPKRPTSVILTLWRITVLLVISSILFFCGRRCTSAPPAKTPSNGAYAMGLDPPTSIDPSASAPSEDPPRLPAPPPRTASSLVSAAIGRWESADGTLEIAVDPPRHDDAGKRPPFHLVVRKDGAIPYGCEFSDPARVRVPGPNVMEGFELTFRAWCGIPGRARVNYLGMSVEGDALRVALTSSSRGHPALPDTVRLSSGPMVRRQTHLPSRDSAVHWISVSVGRPPSGDGSRAARAEDPRAGV